MLKNFTAFLLICLLFGVGNSARRATPDKREKKPVPAEIQEKAVKVLVELAGEAERFSTPVNRVTARISVIELLWDADEKQARAVVQNASSEISSMLSQIPIEIPENEDEESYKRYAAMSDVKTLRTELLLMLAKHDPKLALETLQMLSRKNTDGTNFFEEDQSLELSLAAQIAAKDPKQAYELAKRNLENGLNYNLFSTLEDLYKKDAELGSKLAQDILGKIKSKDTSVNSPFDNPGANTANTNMRVQTAKPSGLVINTWEIQSFLETIKKLNRLAVKDKKSAVLNDGEIRDLLDVLIQKYLRQPYLSSYEISKIMPEIIKYFPSQAQALRAKIGQGESSTLNNLVSAQNFQNETEDKSADEILQIIEKKPAAERDDLYMAAAQKAFSDGDVQNAKKFHSKVKTKPEYDYLNKQIDSALPLAIAETGDLTQVRQMLGKMKSPEERIEVLTALAISTAGKGDLKIASSLLEEAGSMYSGRMKNRRNLASILQLAQAFAVVEPEHSFSFLESNIGYFNDLISAAILLSEFNEYGAVVDEEVRLDNIKSESYRNAPNAVRLIRNLSAADFERTIGLADKFSRSEVRFFTRYRIIEALLNPNAEEEEKTAQTNVSSEEYEH
jgi:hypothetical protein